jgi:hypothetical protein
MKRSRMTRRTPLARRTWIRRPRGRTSVVVAEIWREGLFHERCVVCGGRRDLDGHHAIPRRVLIWHHLDAYLMDKRNRVPVCRHDHESHECRVRPIRRDELPADVFEFALEVGLLWYVDKHYAATVAA